MLLALLLLAAGPISTVRLYESGRVRWGPLGRNARTALPSMRTDTSW